MILKFWKLYYFIIIFKN